MEAHKAPSVFNFYQPEYQPAGPVARAGLVAPEAGLATAPFLIGFLNGMLSLVEVGLSACFNGFGAGCAHSRLRGNYPEVDWSDGRVSFEPSSWNAAEAVGELDLLLTGGRLSAGTKAVIASHYETAAQSGSPPAALKLAQQLMVATPEFHTTNLNPPAATPRASAGGGGASASASDFKAIIVLYMGGGVDSYNMLVPHSNCPGKDMFAHYETWRGDVKLAKDELLEIDVTDTSPAQPCATFGLHPSLDFVRELYADGDAAFVANIGSLIEPMDRTAYYDGTKRIPPQIFAHNMGTKAAHNLHPQDGSSKGVLGRILDAIQEQRSAQGRAYSISGNAKILDGESGAPDIIYAKNGVVKLTLPSIGPMISQVLAPASASVFGETYAGLTEAALTRSEVVGDALADIVLPHEDTFDGSGIADQLKQVAKLVNVSHALQTDRAAFFVQIGGFDTHSDVGAVLEENLGQIDRALRSLVSELKAMGRWDEVAILSKSEFGRTITSNGLGTDHGARAQLPRIAPPSLAARAPSLPSAAALGGCPRRLPSAAALGCPRLPSAALGRPRLDAVRARLARAPGGCRLGRQPLCPRRRRQGRQDPRKVS